MSHIEMLRILAICFAVNVLIIVVLALVARVVA